jgi:hypothetical protein
MEPAFGMVDTQFTVDLHPSALRDVSTYINQILHAQVLTYSKEYSGVVMAYQDARILNSAAPVHNFFPYIHVKVSAKLLILQLFERQTMGMLFLFFASLDVLFKSCTRAEFPCMTASSHELGSNPNLLTVNAFHSYE